MRGRYKVHHFWLLIGFKEQVKRHDVSVVLRPFQQRQQLHQRLLPIVGNPVDANVEGRCI